MQNQILVQESKAKSPDDIRMMTTTVVSVCSSEHDNNQVSKPFIKETPILNLCICDCSLSCMCYWILLVSFSAFPITLS